MSDSVTFCLCGPIVAGQGGLDRIPFSLHLSHPRHRTRGGTGLNKTPDSKGLLNRSFVVKLLDS
jgi:hypothetical protein